MRKEKQLFLPHSAFGVGFLAAYTGGTGRGSDGDRHRRPRGYGRAATARCRISGHALAAAATTARTRENRADQRRDHQLSQGHNFIPPPEQRGGRGFPPTPKHTVARRDDKPSTRLRTTGAPAPGRNGFSPCFSYTVDSPLEAINGCRRSPWTFRGFFSRLCLPTQLG